MWGDEVLPYMVVLCWAALYTRRCVRVNEMGGTFYFMYDRYSGTTRNEFLFVLN